MFISMCEVTSVVLELSHGKTNQTKSRPTTVNTPKAYVVMDVLLRYSHNLVFLSI